ncbi:hypothetical protein [Blastococcus haudaquaticus]|uniref:Uncharacterized protein n=1 Tax=Blastococcus haudaquaticus TaxID=1938745 RepID=A0A286H512_9ACTN|nr:hypothetical protein [Blastococcus haudaquaticus]SOE02374.1 hypothetical protein SAMN06272739_3534 [Blastococcus haudaquaticus]
MPASTSTRPYDVASVVVTFLGLYQGGVPLVVRAVFGAEQRFAPVMWLPAPWWWIACLGIVAVMAALLTVIHRAKARHAPPPATGTDVPAAEEDPHEARDAGYDALSAIVLLAGVYNGIAPFVSRLFFDGDLFLAFTLRLPAPWWWIASLVVVALAVVLLAVIDRAKNRDAAAG